MDINPFSSPEHQAFTIGQGGGLVLLVHGFPGTPAEMRPLGQALAGRGWYVHAPLLPGFGPGITTLPSCKRSDWLSKLAADVRDQRSPGQPLVLIGFSMGAALVLNLATELNADRLILLAPFWRLKGLLPRLIPLLKWFAPPIKPFEKADFSDPAVRDRLKAILPEANLDDPAVQAVIREEFALPLKVVDEVLALGREAYQRAKQVAAPTLVLQGQEDELVSPQMTAKLVGRLSNEMTSYRMLPGGHDLLTDGALAQSEVLALVVAFLEPIAGNVKSGSDKSEVFYGDQ
jgi:carboxylesterase